MTQLHCAMIAILIASAEMLRPAKTPVKDQVPRIEKFAPPAVNFEPLTTTTTTRRTTTTTAGSKLFANLISRMFGEPGRAVTALIPFKKPRTEKAVIGLPPIEKETRPTLIDTFERPVAAPPSVDFESEVTISANNADPDVTTRETNTFPEGNDTTKGSFTRILPSSGDADNSTFRNKIKTAAPAYDKASDGIYRLCGYPAYNSREKCRALNMTFDPLWKCEVNGGAASFGFVVVLLALVIVVSNSLVPLAVWRHEDMRTQYDYIKVSLAFADMIMGIVLLFSVLPNMLWFRRSTESEVVEVAMTTDRNSPKSIILGSLLTLSAQLSLLHLMFLSIERFIAIQWSFWHRLRKTSTVLLTLAALWIIPILASFTPAIFSDFFEYTYQPVLSLHTMTLRFLPDGTLGYHGPLYAAITMILPYAITVVFSVLTGFVVRRKLSDRAKMFGSEIGNSSSSGSCSNNASGIFSSSHRKTAGERSRLKPEITVFVTIVIMVIGFSVTLLPVAIIVILFSTQQLGCSDYSLPYTICFYTSISNSFVNAIIYSIRDKRFRDAISSIFHKNLKSSEPSKYKNSSRSSDL